MITLWIPDDVGEPIAVEGWAYEATALCRAVPVDEETLNAAAREIVKGFFDAHPDARAAILADPTAMHDHEDANIRFESVVGPLFNRLTGYGGSWFATDATSPEKQQIANTFTDLWNAVTEARRLEFAARAAKEERGRRGPMTAGLLIAELARFPADAPVCFAHCPHVSLGIDEVAGDDEVRLVANGFSDEKCGC